MRFLARLAVCAATLLCAHTVFAQDDVAVQWAERMGAYAASNDPASKGYFGSPSGTVQKLLESRALYLEAKALYEEFKNTGIDKDSHYQLRAAEYDIRISIQNYESSQERVFSNTESTINERAGWIATQKTADTPLRISPLQLAQLLEDGKSVCSLLAEGDPRRVALEACMARMRQDQAAVEKVILKTRKMKEDAYKGADANKVKEVAKSTALKELAKKEYGGKAPQIVRVHIISSRWNTESALEWTDTTKSAVQYRVTKGLNVQVVAKSGTTCYLFTLFVHEDTISGSSSGLLAHVMFRDDFLEANIPK